MIWMILWMVFGPVQVGPARPRVQPVKHFRLVVPRPAPPIARTF